MHTYTWNEPDMDKKTKVYEYFTFKNNLVYAVIFVTDTSKDATTKPVRDTIFNSVKIENLGQGATS